jgi:hypothetical protein
MSEPAEWTTPADIRSELRRHWRQGRILAARLADTPLFPLTLRRFRRPDAKALSAHFDAVRKWIRALEEGSKAARGFGYDILWEEINHRQLGRNRLPAGTCVASERDALRLIGMQREAERFAALADATLTQFPTLRDWLVRYPLRALAHADDWQRIVAVLAWFRDHPRAGLYLRQIDIPGIDTKFIETRRGLLSELLDRVLPPAAVDPRFAAGRAFEQRYGLTAEPPLVRFRLLDRRLAIRGLSDLTVPAADFARLDFEAERVFVTENKINGLAFPASAGGLVVFGLGNALALLAEAAWLARKTLYYWGDIDTHGFAILDRMRAVFPETRSFLMDRRTLLAHRASWVRESDRYEGALDRLTAAEQDLFEELKRDLLGDHVRLEQELIAFGWLERALSALPAL